MPTVLVAGASRGIGLEFVRQYASDGWRVVAGCRRPDEASELQALTSEGRIEVHALDVASDSSVATFKEAVGDELLDLLICSAGAPGGGRQALGDIDFAEMARTLEVNMTGPLRVVQAFTPNLSKAPGAKLIAITSGMGSIQNTTSTEMMIYRISKAGLNEAWRCVAIELQPKGITATVIHPGWVATAMGGENAPVSPKQSVNGMRDVIAGLRPDDTGTFRTFDGGTLPW